MIFGAAMTALHQRAEYCLKSNPNDCFHNVVYFILKLNDYAPSSPVKCTPKKTFTLQQAPVRLHAERYSC